LKNRDADTFDRYVIAKLQGLCFYQLDGGKESAFNRFDEAVGILNQRKGKIRASYLHYLGEFKGVGSPYEQFYGKYYEQMKTCTSDKDFEHIIYENVAELKTIITMEACWFNRHFPTSAYAGNLLDYRNGYLELSRMAEVLTEIRRN